MTLEPHDHSADGDAVASPRPPQTEKRRTRSGCAICRRRKIKCDERASGCIACERLQLECPGYGVNALPVSGPLNTSSDVTKAGIKRRRVWQSCAACRRSKTRCSSGRPPCARCEKRGLICSYTDTHRPVPSLLPTENALTVGSESATPIRTSTTPTPLESISWLYSDHLPDLDHIRELVEDYFAVFHPLRCFNFLHKPTFIQSLDNGLVQDRDNALLHVVCSLGAKSYALRHVLKSGMPSPKWILTAGNKWADFALRKVLDELNIISVENLMAAVILQDQQIRLGKYSTAFMLTGFTTRMAQALQINLEFSSDVLCNDSTKSPNATSKESRRRLMWACYITDASVGSGVDQLTLLNEEDIKIQLPCEERQFILQTPCVTELLKPGEVLSFIPEHSLPATPSASMGLTAYYIRLIAIRKRILRYVKQLSSAQSPWLPESEFNTLRNACAEWRCSLPQNLQYSPATLYIRAETGELGALCLLHGTYNETLIDLYRIFAPALYKLRSTFEFPSDQRDYLVQRQRELYDHARSIANIAIEAMNRQGPTALADFWWPSITYDSCRHMVYYVTQVQPGNSELMSDTTKLLESNLRALGMMRQLCAMAEPLFRAASKMLSKLNVTDNGHNIGPEDPMESDETCSATAPGTPTQTTPDYVLHPLSIYRMARKSIPEKHAPEKTTPTSTTAHDSSPTTTSLHDSHTASPGSGLAADGPTPTTALPLPPAGENLAPHRSWMDEELQLQCPPEMTSFWEPAATVESGLYNTELPPWLTDFQQDQCWLEFWPGPRE